MSSCPITSISSSRSKRRPTNDKIHLGRIVRKLKTFTATIYRKMKAAGEISDFGINGLWQTDFWEVIVTNHDQLDRPFVAYVTSEGDASAAHQKLWSRAIACGKTFVSAARSKR